MIKQIREGWFNHFRDLLGTLPAEIKAEAEVRLLTCYSCDLRTNFICDPTKKGVALKTFHYGNALREEGKIYRGCGCALKQKAKSMDSKCPLGKW